MSNRKFSDITGNRKVSEKAEIEQMTSDTYRVDNGTMLASSMFLDQNVMTNDFQSYIKEENLSYLGKDYITQPKLDISLAIDQEQEEEENFSSNMEILEVAGIQLFQGIMGAFVYLQLLSSLVLTIVMVGQLTQPINYLSAVGVGIAWIGLFASFCLGLNQGFNIIVNRCIGLQQYGLIRYYIIRQHKIVGVFIIGFWIIMFIIYLQTDIMYPHNKEIAKDLKTFIFYAAPGIISMFLVDIFRNLTLGLGLYISAFVCELVTLFSVLFFVYLLGFMNKSGYTGIIIGVMIGLFLGYISFIVNYMINKGFMVIPSLQNILPFFRKNSKKSNTSTDQIKQNEKEEEKENDLSGYNDLGTYLKFIFQFAQIFLIENGWLRLDLIIGSWILDKYWCAALSPFYNVVTMFDCFSFGYGYAVLSRMTKLLIRGQVKKAKTVAMLSIAGNLLVSVTQSILIYSFRRNISRTFINPDDDAADYDEVSKNSMSMTFDHQTEQFTYYPLTIPFQLMWGVQTALIRSLNSQSIVIYAQIICQYIFHVGCLYYFFYFTELKGLGQIACLFLTYIILVTCMLIVIFSMNWNEIVTKMRNDILHQKQIEYESRLSNTVNNERL